MALQSSGPISMSQVRTEFKGTSSGSISFSEMYRYSDPEWMSSNNVQVPASGAFSMSKFYNTNKWNEFRFLDKAVLHTNVSISNNTGSNYYSGFVPNRYTEIYIGNEVGIISNSNGIPALLIGNLGANCTIYNSGIIMGKGGKGGGGTSAPVRYVAAQSGGDAVQIVSNYTNAFYNYGYLCPGGGGGGGHVLVGGGGGAGGGAGGDAYDFPNSTLRPGGAGQQLYIYTYLGVTRPIQNFGDGTAHPQGYKGISYYMPGYNDNNLTDTLAGGGGGYWGGGGGVGDDNPAPKGGTAVDNDYWGTGGGGGCLYDPNESSDYFAESYSRGGYRTQDRYGDVSPGVVGTYIHQGGDGGWKFTAAEDGWPYNQFALDNSYYLLPSALAGGGGGSFGQAGGDSRKAITPEPPYSTSVVNPGASGGAALRKIGGSINYVAGAGSIIYGALAL